MGQDYANEHGIEAMTTGFKRQFPKPETGILKGFSFSCPVWRIRARPLEVGFTVVCPIWSPAISLPRTIRNAIVMRNYQAITPRC